jgi:hypothetical protein
LRAFSRPFAQACFEAGSKSRHPLFGLQAEGFDRACRKARQNNAADRATNDPKILDDGRAIQGQRNAEDALTATPMDGIAQCDTHARVH